LTYSSEVLGSCAEPLCGSARMSFLTVLHAYSQKKSPQSSRLSSELR
jgi:hypothetical protein